MDTYMNLALVTHIRTCDYTVVFKKLNSKKRNILFENLWGKIYLTVRLCALSVCLSVKVR